MRGRAELNLLQPGRELIFRGDLQRMGNTRFTWLDTHALLLDNYLVLAKTVNSRDSSGAANKYDKYDVSKLPIPMDLLVLESFDDPAVVKSKVQGITAAPTQVLSPVETRVARSGSASLTSPVSLQHSNTATNLTTIATNNSYKQMTTTTVLEGAKDEKTMFPFRIKHLGNEAYTLFAPSAQSRQDWCENITKAKATHARCSIRKRCSVNGQRSLLVQGTPIARAIEDVEKSFADKGRPVPICRARVNCALTFSHSSGKQMHAVGTDYGVYVTEAGQTRGWSRVAVLEDFNLFLLISDKALIAYPLDVIIPSSSTDAAQANESPRKAPQKLSGARDVAFFATGKIKERTLVVYKKRDGLSSMFKVLEPVLAGHTRRPLTRTNSATPPVIDHWRDFTDFTINSDATSLSIFNSTLAIATTASSLASAAVSATTPDSASSVSSLASHRPGFEVLTLDKLVPFRVPDLRSSHVAAISARLAGVPPLVMLRVDGSEFLAVYETCAVYLNRHGEVSRSVVMAFVGKARAAAMLAGAAGALRH
ncbi:hypothetical protein MRB53_037637 [Persea americana]|nr:hypothetical protein MRB53_037637 [Persea americana]